MPLVRDKTKQKTEHLGKFIWAAENDCPCRSCYHVHLISTDDYRCLRNHCHGCPDPLPEPEHIWNKRGRCIRCGAFKKKYKD